jgi:hypothetical protein
MFVADGKTVEFDVQGSVVVIDDPELVISAALEGIGIAYLYEGYVASLVADGRLVSLLDKTVLPVTDGSFCSIRAAGKTRRRCVRSLNFCGRTSEPLRSRQKLRLSQIRPTRSLKRGACSNAWRAAHTPSSAWDGRRILTTSSRRAWPA